MSKNSLLSIVPSYHGIYRETPPLALREVIQDDLNKLIDVYNGISGLDLSYDDYLDVIYDTNVQTQDDFMVPIQSNYFHGLKMVPISVVNTGSQKNQEYYWGS